MDARVADPFSSRTFLNSITPPPMWARLQEIEESQPDVFATMLMLGRDRAAEWVHSIGVVKDEQLRAAAPPIPPRELRLHCSSGDEEVFLWTGQHDLRTFLSLYEKHVGEYRPSHPRVLDFGCGPGRLTRFLGASSAYVTSACDMNPQHVAWCQANLARVRTVLNAHTPPLSFDSGSFDFVFLLSVLTHLTETAARDWLAEIARVTTTGAIVIVTTHGFPALETIAASQLHRDMFDLRADDVTNIIGRVRGGDHVFVQYSDASMLHANVPPPYGSAFMAPEKAQQLWSIYFETLEHVPGGQRGWQDIFALRRKA